MSSVNPKNREKTVRNLSPKDYAATAPVASTESLYIDTKGFRWAKFILSVGTITSTGSVAAKIQESSDNFSSDAAADVSGATFTTLTGASDDSIQAVVVDCSKTERYLTVAFTFTTTTVANLSGVCILSNAVDSIYVGTNSADAAVVAQV